MTLLVRRHRSVVTALSLAALVCFLPLHLFASTVIVYPTSTTPCSTAHPLYTSIQTAVNAVPAGSTIQVCPGNYYEQVVISKKLTLEGIVGASQDAAVIFSPSGGLAQNTIDVDTSNPIAAQILVQNVPVADPVNISNLTVDGTGNMDSCGPDVQGILYQSASGTVNHVAVRNQLPNGSPNGCQVGESIYVQTATTGDAIFGSNPPADYSVFTSTVIVENSSVHNYNKNGITGNDAGTSLTATGNYVQGSGVVAYPGAAQNGIQLAFGATGKVNSNVVIDNIYGDINIAASTDILLFDTAENSAITVNSNTLANSQIPIYLGTDSVGSAGDDVTVNANKIMGTSVYDAIDVCSDNDTVTNNTIFDSAESGVHLDSSCGNTGDHNVVTGNIMLESACAGVLEDAGTSNNGTITGTFYTVPYPITSSTASCSIPVPGAKTKAKAKASKLSPAR